jgi:hypothetical protein
MALHHVVFLTFTAAIILHLAFSFTPGIAIHASFQETFLTG